MRSCLLSNMFIVTSEFKPNMVEWNRLQYVMLAIKHQDAHTIFELETVYNHNYEHTCLYFDPILISLAP